MALAEIDEAELASLRGVAAIFNKTLGSKEREKLLRAVKGANPDLPIPELDARAPVDAEISGVKDEMKAFREEIAKDRADRKAESDRAQLTTQWNAGRSKARKLGYSGESLDELEKFMEEKGVADHEVAAAAFEKMHPKAQPVSNPTNKFNIFGQPNADDTISKSIVDMRDGKIDGDQQLDFSINEVLREMRA